MGKPKRAPKRENTWVWPQPPSRTDSPLHAHFRASGILLDVDEQSIAERLLDLLWTRTHDEVEPHHHGEGHRSLPAEST
jgi:hypothetical protein